VESIEETIRRTMEVHQIEPDPAITADLSAYVRELERWNRRMNLTGLQKAEAVIQRLISDALFLHTVIPRQGSVLDLGSGAGILAVPLAVLNRSRRVFSMDKSLKKAQFQRHVKRLLSLANMEMFQGRAEDLAPVDADILVAKAFGPVSQILRLGRRHLSPAALVFLVRGGREEASEEEAFVLENVRHYGSPEGARTYQLFIYKKVT
jgi:16S rRNA (guanine527-N7)-methyltransferase